MYVKYNPDENEGKFYTQKALTKTVQKEKEKLSRHFAEFQVHAC